MILLLLLLEALFETAMQLPFGISGKIFSECANTFTNTHTHTQGVYE